MCPGLAGLLSYLLSAKGCGSSLLRAGMTSVGVGHVIRYCIVHVGGVLSVCARPLACCCKNVFRQKGVRVDTVAVSLFLATVWNSLVQGKERGRWAGSPSGNVSCCLWGGGQKNTPLATAVMWHQESHIPFVALDVSFDPGRAGFFVSTLSPRCCLIGTRTCFSSVTSNLPPGLGRHAYIWATGQTREQKDSFLYLCKLFFFFKHSPEFPHLSIPTLCLAHFAHPESTTALALAAQSRETSGGVTMATGSGERLYGVRARQCYRLFCSKQ